MAQGETDRKGTTGFAALRIRDFSLFVFGKLFSVLAYHMILVAIAYQVYDLTSDPLSLAILALTMIGPALGLGLFVGYVVDVVDRRLILIISFCAFAVTSGLICAFSVVHLTVIWPYYLVMFFVGVARAFYGPTSNAFVPILVPIEVFPNAVSWNATVGKIAQIAGPAMGGLLYLWGPETVYGTATIVFIGGVFSSVMISSRKEQSRNKVSFSLRSLTAGISYVIEKRMILGAVSVDMMVAVFGGAAALIPIFARDVLEVGPSGAGALRSALALGGLLSALVLTRVPLRRKAGTIMLWGVVCYGLATIGFALSTSFVLSIFMLALAGASDMMNVTVRQTLLQIATPDLLRGRVSAVNSVSANIGTELGQFRAGSFASLMGEVPAVAVGGVLLILCAALCPKLFPELAAVDRVDRSLAPE